MFDKAGDLPIGVLIFRDMNMPHSTGTAKGTSFAAVADEQTLGSYELFDWTTSLVLLQERNSYLKMARHPVVKS